MSSQWVALTTRFTPGWPWPENSYGMDPRYGEDGWCRGCGTPLREQVGPLTIHGSKFPSSPVWMPNWTGDVVCVSAEVAAEIQRRLAVQLRDVHTPRQGATGAMQVIPSVTRGDWYDRDDLAKAIVARHGRWNGDQIGNTCESCDRWKWLPISDDEATIRSSSLNDDLGDVIASPEDFGDGLNSFKHLLFKRPLGAFLAAAHPKHWSVVEVSTTDR